MKFDFSNTPASAAFFVASRRSGRDRFSIGGDWRYNYGGFAMT
jgi:hypothetical protein